MFDDALHLHQQGQLDEAELAYRQLLRKEPEHAGALHLLGVIHQQRDDHETALELIGRAIAVNPNKAVYHNNYGAALHSLDRLDEAEASFRRALSICPNYADALANLGMAKTTRDEEAAEASFRRALQIQPWHRDATTRLAALLDNHGRNAEARQLMEAALAAAPCPEFHATLGNLLLREGSAEQAAGHYRAAIKLKADDAIAHFNLGLACEELHDTNRAEEHFGRAAELRPEKRLWRLRAELCGPAVFESAEEIEAYCERVKGAVEGWKNEEPSPPAPLPNRERGDNEPSPPVSLPQAARGVEEPLLGRRAGLGLDDILEAGALPHFGLAYHGRDQRRLKEQFAAMYEPYFRDQPVARHSRPWSPTQARCLCHAGDRPRVGILVTQRHEGMFLQSMQGIIEQLDGNRLEPVVLCSRPILKTLKTRIRREGLRFAPFGDSLGEAMRQVREAACDLIYYWEVGTDAMNYFLPFGRLAPVQCTGWATMTSGVPAVDWFFSSALVESPGSQAQYTERLWQSRTLFRYQDRARATRPAARGEFGLPEGRHLYVCFQNPLKLHPDIDPLLAGVLEADPRALVVLLADRSGQVARRLKERFGRRIPQAQMPSPPAPLPERAREVEEPSPPAGKSEIQMSKSETGSDEPTGTGWKPILRQAERIVFLPPQPFGEYCRLLQLADVILDPPHYGANSSCYDIFSYNLPLVTMPGKLFVGRVTQAFYRKMGIEDLIVHSPDEYVSKAAQVASDRDYRKYVTELIAQASDVLFNDLEAVREHERFFEEAMSGVK